MILIVSGLKGYPSQRSDRISPVTASTFSSLFILSLEASTSQRPLLRLYFGDRVVTFFLHGTIS